MKAHSWEEKKIEQKYRKKNCKHAVVPEKNPLNEGNKQKVTREGANPKNIILCGLFC